MYIKKFYSTRLEMLDGRKLTIQVSVKPIFETHIDNTPLWVDEEKQVACYREQPVAITLFIEEGEGAAKKYTEVLLDSKSIDAISTMCADIENAKHVGYYPESKNK